MYCIQWFRKKKQILKLSLLPDIFSFLLFAVFIQRESMAIKINFSFWETDYRPFLICNSRQCDCYNTSIDNECRQVTIWNSLMTFVRKNLWTKSKKVVATDYRYLCGCHLRGWIKQDELMLSSAQTDSTLRMTNTGVTCQHWNPRQD